MPVSERFCAMCHKAFMPNKFSGSRQTVCGESACRKAAKKVRQAAWQARNPDYFRGPEHVERVRQWRRDHPGWLDRQRALREVPPEKSTPEAESCNSSRPPLPVLQDLAPDAQTSLFVGLASFISGSVLQDEVHDLLRKCLRRGGDLLRPGPGTRAPFVFPTTTTTATSPHGKIPDRSRADPASAPAL